MRWSNEHGAELHEGRRRLPCKSRSGVGRSGRTKRRRTEVGNRRRSLRADDNDGRKRRRGRRRGRYVDGSLFQ